MKKVITNKSVSVPDKNSKVKIIGVKELFRETFKDYKNNWQKFGYLLILPLTLSFVGSLYFYAVKTFISQDAIPVMLIAGLVGIIFMIFFCVLYLISYIAQLLLVADLSQEVNLGNTKEWYKKSRAYFWLVAGISLLFMLLSVISFVALIIPGIIFVVFYSFALYAALYENHKFEGSFGRSRELVSGYWWPVFGRFMAGLAVMYLFYSVIALMIALSVWLPAYLLKFIINPDLFNLLYSLLSLFISLIVGPLTLLYTYKIYQSLKTVKWSNE